MLGEKTLEKLIEWNPIITGVGFVLAMLVLPILLMKIAFILVGW